MEDAVRKALADCLELIAGKLMNDPLADELCDRLVGMVERKPWIWMPHPAHYICARYCRFILSTCVGDFIVSTVGEYVPSDAVREMYARTRGINLEGRGDAREKDFIEKCGFTEVGAGRTYETMVFLAEKAPERECGCKFRPKHHRELDMLGYNDAASAYAGHMRLCEEWSVVKAGPEHQREE